MSTTAMMRSLTLLLSIGSILFAQSEMAVAPKVLRWEDVKPNIFPVVMSAVGSSDTTSAFSISHGSLVGVAYNEEIQIMYMIGNKSQYVNKEQIKEWNVTSDSIGRVALANLARVFAAHGELSTNSARTFCRLAILNNEYDASLLLMTDSWMPSVRSVLRTDDVRMFIPRRDELFLVAANSESGQKSLNEETNRLEVGKKGAISPVLFKYESGKWVNPGRE